jgi:hypothetical protein
MVGVIFGAGIVLAMGLMIAGLESRAPTADTTNTSQTTTLQENSLTAASSGSNAVHSDLPQTILFGTQPNPESNTTTSPANTLVWTSYEISNLTSPFGAETQLQVTPQNYNSQVTLAAYINGESVSSATYVIPPMTAPPSAGNSNDLPKQYQVGLSLSLPSSISAGSVVSLSVLSTTPIIIYVNTLAQSSSIPSTSIPHQLPSTTPSLNYAPDIYAYSG